MNVLNQRQIQLINLLAGENEWLPANRAAEILKISVSTLRRDVDTINDFYHNKDHKIDSKPGLGLKLVGDKAFSLPHTPGDNAVQSILKNKRLIGITTDLLTLSPAPQSINELAEKYFISRSSIVTDLRKIEVWIASFDLKIVKNHTGTFIKGSDFNIRMALKDIITYSVLNNYQMTDSRIDRFSRVQLIKEFGKQNVANCMTLISIIEDELQCSICEPYYTNLFSHLLVTIRRAKNQHQEHCQDDYVRAENKEWHIAEKAIEWLEAEYNIALPTIEVSYIYQYIVSSGIHSTTLSTDEHIYTGHKAGDYSELLIKAVSASLNIDLSYDQVLRHALISHIKPMLNRLTYNIIIHNPLLDEIRQELASVFAAVKMAVDNINNELNLLSASDDEVAYLTVYIQAAIEKIKVSKKIILVCSSGIGTSQLLYSRIKRAFPEWDIVDIVPGARLKEVLQQKACDLIISTIRLDDINIPIAYVSALFSTKDITRVTECLGADLNLDLKEKYDVR
ncbi:BglG family transcription antiterminator [Kluyvera georgiana]|uniref:BglG family transcription antiterminator n=1 Tax=Kluyvera georgiana TaxID=73098 RepID=UPI003D983312